jgi:hypothetical protein
MAALWWLRWTLVAIAAVLGAVLISRHHVLIGVLIVAMALVRATLLVAMSKRRAARRAQRHGRFGPPP